MQQMRSGDAKGISKDQATDFTTTVKPDLRLTRFSMAGWEPELKCELPCVKEKKVLGTSMCVSMHTHVCVCARARM